MADTKISALTAGTATSGDEVPVNRAGTNFKVDVLAIAALAAKATTTEVLTGTGTTQAVTPDSLAALWEKGTDVASAGTISLGEGGFFHITGTTTITDIDFATPKDGRVAILEFDGALVLTHHATTLVIPGAANITTAAGDRCGIVQDSGDNIHVLWYQKAAESPFNILNGQVFTATGANTYTPTVGMRYCLAIITGGGGSGGAATGNPDAGSGGGAGGTAIEIYSAATIGVNQTVTIGIGAVASGNTGTTSTFGALMSALGGVGGITSAGAGGIGGVPTGGLINITGGDGEACQGGSNPGGGGASFWGGGPTTVPAGNAVGLAGKCYGSGGSGGAANSATDRAGGAGMAGVCLVIEFA